MTDELKEFIDSFPTEQVLRRDLETLLGKINGNRLVRQLHGAEELGKDIIYYGPGGLDNDCLYACVVKKTKITGSADSDDGARNVLIQAEQALDTPHTTEKGAEEWVGRVFVMSPHDCPPQTMTSIKGKLKARSGQIEFCCGVRLLELFKKHWPEFLEFKSRLLGTYFTNLRDRLVRDTPLENLCSRHGLSAVRTPFVERYVRPTFTQTLQTYSFTLEFPDLSHLQKPNRLHDAKELGGKIDTVASFVRVSQVWPDIVSENDAKRASEELTSLAKSIIADWGDQYDKNRSEAESKGERLDRQTTTVRMSHDNLLSRHSQGIEVARDVVERFRRTVDDANAFVTRRHTSTKHGNTLLLLREPDFLNYCRVQDVARLLPTVLRPKGSGTLITYLDDLPLKVSCSLFVTGSAGHGKTSFCRSSILRDISAYEEDSATMIPVFIPLHRFSQGDLGTFEDTFVGAPDLKAYLDSDEQRRWHLRVYLDGLDEVASTPRQHEIVELVRKAIAAHPAMQIVITAREYANGPWLRWIPNVKLGEFSIQQSEELIRKWLGKDSNELEKFSRQLDAVFSLKPLMRVPLLATLILAVYKHLHELPESKVRLYDIFVELLSGGWDLAKGVQRNTEFGAKPKLTILTRLARTMQYAGKRDANKADFKSAVKNTLSGLLPETHRLLNEICEDGLLVPFGDNFCFPHLSFQEFLTAKSLCSTGVSDRTFDMVLRRFLRGDDWWKEVLIFYIGLSGNPQEMEHWIRLKAGARNALTDIPQRVDFLLLELKNAFPGY
jgi:hypothetical protein